RCIRRSGAVVIRSRRARPTRRVPRRSSRKPTANVAPPTHRGATRQRSPTSTRRIVARRIFRGFSRSAVTGPLSTVILAAGEGTRMKSSRPKVLHHLAGRPLVEHAVRAAWGLEPDQLVVVVGHGRTAVTEHLTRLSDTLGTSI